MHHHLDKITTLTYKTELIRGRNIALILISFNILILIILVAQEFVYLPEHNDIEATLMTIMIICFGVGECFGLHTIIYLKQNRMKVYHLMFINFLSVDLKTPNRILILQIVVIIGEFVEIYDENIRFHILETSIRFVLIFLMLIMNILKYVSVQYMSLNFDLSKANSMIRLGMRNEENYLSFLNQSLNSPGMRSQL